MAMKSATAAFAAFGILVMALPATAGTVTERMRRDCRSDYNRYCKAYPVGSEGLRACMSRSIRGVSNRCVGALVAGGEMTQAQADRLRKRRR
jgi:hypothetical protein